MTNTKWSDDIMEGIMSMEELQGRRAKKGMIGIFKGKVINDMTRDELLEFARYAAEELARLMTLERTRLDNI